MFECHYKVAPSSNGKEPACNAGGQGSIPGSGRSSGEGNSNPLQYWCPENPTERSLAGYSSWGRKESNTSEWDQKQKDFLNEWVSDQRICKWMHSWVSPNKQLKPKLSKMRNCSSSCSLTAINPFNFFLKLGDFRGLPEISLSIFLCQRPKIQHVLTFLLANSTALICITQTMCIPKMNLLANSAPGPAGNLR